jgi:UDP-N-acetylglucosamine 2-epimerase
MPIMKWILVAAARPNFMKIAPLMRAIAGHNRQNGNTMARPRKHTASSVCTL